MEKDGIDASISLGFSLELFKRYKRTGTLQAKLRRFPSIQTPATAYIDLLEGVVTSCHIEDKNGQYSPVSKGVLIRFDNEKGPLEWSFRSLSGAPAAETPYPVSAIHPFPHNTGPLTFQTPHAAVLKAVSSLPGEQLLSWTIQQRRMFLLVWQEIDGKRALQDIKNNLAISLSEAAVEEVLLTLLKLKLIVISTK